jgi:ABC-2 type transport system ATP-binding protein
VTERPVGHSLEAVGLTKSYGSFTALSNLNLKLEGTKCVGFLGPNGAGKTTTLKIFTDLIKPTSGRALIDGIDVQRHKMAALGSVGALIETPEIYPALTPKEALRLVAEAKGVPREERNRRIEEAVAEVRMEGWMDKRVGKFSKGMKQRISIASALVGDPDILIFDEPTAGLDPRGMTEVRAIIKGLRTKDRLVFMSSHLLPEVTDVCQEVAMIDHGKLIVFDTLSNVTNKFSGGGSRAEVGFMREVDDSLVARVRSLEGVTDAQKADPDHISIKFEGGKPVQERIFGQLAKMNAGAISFRESATGLEDAYLNLITETL